MRNTVSFRSVSATALLALALAVTGCSFTTTTPAEPTDASSRATTPEGDTETASVAPTDLAGLIDAFVEAELIDAGATYPLAFEGVATDAMGADDAGGGTVEFYYVDLETASDAVLANYELAKSEGTADYGGGIMIPIDDVAGPFMIAYSSASDAAAIQAKWEEITTGLE